jgi:hypothetical protein
MDPSQLIAALPPGLRNPLIESYREIGANYLENRWEPSELNGGKFCEVVYSILNGVLSGRMPAGPSKPRQMLQACQQLEQVPPDSNRIGDRSLRILIPRILPALYEIRNNRGVGHVGGDVNPNFLDATAVYSMASWVLAELVRIFHNVTTQKAQAVVDALIERKNPLIWEVQDGTRRVLDAAMGKADQVLVLLHGTAGWLAIDDLVRWVEYSNKNMFKTRIVARLHKARMVEHDEKQQRVRISPLGVKDVESRIINSRST